MMKGTKISGSDEHHRPLAFVGGDRHHHAGDQLGADVEDEQGDQFAAGRLRGQVVDEEEASAP